MAVAAFPRWRLEQAREELHARLRRAKKSWYRRRIREDLRFIERVLKDVDAGEQRSVICRNQHDA